MTMELNRGFKGVWIPREIYLNPNLSRLEKDILVEIDSLDNDEGCFATNRHFAEFCGCSARTVTRAVVNLENLGYITVVNAPGKRRILHSNVRVMFPEAQDIPSTECPGGIDKMSRGVDKMSRGVRQNVYHSNTYSKPLSNTDSSSSSPYPLLHEGKEDGGADAHDDTADAVETLGQTEWDSFITAYQQNIEAMPRPMKMQGLKEDFDILGAEMMMEAVKRTVDANPSNAAPYFDKVVRAWIKEGIDTPEKARLTAEQRTRKGVSTRAAEPTADEEWEKEKRRRYNDLSPERLYG